MDEEAMNPYHPIYASHSQNASFTLNVYGEGTKNGCCHNLNVHSILKEFVARETLLRVRDIQLSAVRETYPNPTQEVGCSCVDPLPRPQEDLETLENGKKKLIYNCSWIRADEEPSDLSEDKNDVFMDSTDLEHDEYNKVLKMLP